MDRAEDLVGAVAGLAPRAEEVGEAANARTVSRWSGILSFRHLEGEKEKLLHMEDRIEVPADWASATGEAKPSSQGTHEAAAQPWSRGPFGARGPTSAAVGSIRATTGSEWRTREHPPTQPSASGHPDLGRSLLGCLDAGRRNAP